MRVLVVDDHELNRMLLSELIAAAGHEAVLAANASEAVLRAALTPCDLLLLDLNLPDMPGDRLLKLLRELPGHAETPAWVASGGLDLTRATALQAQGFAGVLAKPIDTAALASILAAAGRPEPVPAIERDQVEVGRLLDDEQGLRSCGSVEVLSRMRALFAVELADETGRLKEALETGDHAAVRQRLHRLSASAGFCGASAFAQACSQLARALDRREDPSSSFAALAETAARTREALNPQTSAPG